jgi:hypothetical protein
MNRMKIIIFSSLLLICGLTYYISFCYTISAGKRIGNLTKLSLKGTIIKTWEGTINEGFGEKLTTYFSISDDDVAKQLYQYEGRRVVIYYEEHYVGWPRDTKYDVIRWEAQQEDENGNMNGASGLAPLKLLSKLTFCAFLGTLKNNEALYNQVKSYMEANNQYLYKQYDECNK